MVDLRWAPPSRDDDPDWVALLAAIEDVDERGETYEVADLGDEWDSVWSHPETDARFVWDGPELVAFAWLKAMPGQRKHHRVGCWGGVRPSHRRRGIGTALFEWSLQRGTEIAEQFDASLPVEMDIDADDQQRDLVAVVDEGGLRGRAHVPGAGPTRHRARAARPGARPVSSSCRGAPSSTRRRAWPTSRPSPTTGAASRAAPRSGRSGTRGTATSGPTSRCSPSTPPAARSPRSCSRAAYPQDWERLPPRGVDQHRRHPAGLAGQGGGALADERRPPAHRRRRLRLRARHPRRRLREPHRRPRARTAASATRTSVGSASLEPARSTPLPRRTRCSARRRR